MSSVILYGNSQLINAPMQKQCFHEVEPECLAYWEIAVGEYGVDHSSIQVAKTAESLNMMIEQQTLKNKKTTLIIPGGYAPGLYTSFSTYKTDALMRKMVQEGKFNCLGSCSGMAWMIQDRDCDSGKREFFPDCVAVRAFQQQEAGAHGIISKAPVVDSLLPSYKGRFQAFWNSGVCAVLENKQGTVAIARYPEMDIRLNQSFQQVAASRKWNLMDGSLNSDYYPYAGIMRTTDTGSVLVGLGFHPEMPFEKEKMTLPISYEENTQQSKKFLWSILDLFDLKRQASSEDKDYSDTKRASALEVNTLAEQLFAQKII